MRYISLGLACTALLTLGGCAGNEQAASDWWGDNGGAFSKPPVRAPFGNPNGTTWSPFGQKPLQQQPAIPSWRQPQAQPPAGMMVPNAGAYPPPPTIPPAPNGNWNVPRPQTNDPYAVAPVPQGIPDPDNFPQPPSDVEGLYQQQDYSPELDGAPPPVFSQPLNGNAALTPEARAGARLQSFNTEASAFPAPPPPAMQAAVPPPSTGETVIVFAGGSSRVTPENDALLKQAAEQYAQAGLRLVVEGQPSSGTDTAQATARAQAGAVARYLISYGIATTGVMISTAAPNPRKTGMVTIRPAPYL